jgi:hypothetical protein
MQAASHNGFHSVGQRGATVLLLAGAVVNGPSSSTNKTKASSAIVEKYTS